MKKLLYILAFLPLFVQGQTINTFSGSEVSRTGTGSTNLVGYKARDLSGNALAGFLSISGTDTTSFITDNNGDGNIGNTNNTVKISATSVGIAARGTAASDASSIFTLVSTSKGFLTPRMTAAQKNAIASPATGLLIYQTDGTAGFYYYTGATWTGFGGGLTINSTSISGGGANRILFENSSNQLSETATDFYFQTATPFAHVFASGRTGTISGVNNSAFGYFAGKALTTATNGTYIGYNTGAASIAQTHCTYVGANAGAIATGSSNTFIGSDVGSQSSTGSDNTYVGHRAGYDIGNGARNTIIGRSAGFQMASTVDAVFIGYLAGYSTGAGASYSIFIGSNPSASSQSYASSIAIGYNAIPTGTRQGLLGSNDANGYITDWYFNGVTRTTAPYPAALRGSGGSGTDVAGAVLSLIPGIGTGSATTNGYLSISTCPTALASGTTAQTVTEVVRITKTGDILMLNAANGLILKDAAGTPHYWRVTIDAAGAIVTTDLGTTTPN